MRLLIIEQNQNLSQVIHAVVSGEGHEVMWAASGEQALRIFRQRPADVVLGGMELGEEDGLEVLRQLRAGPSGTEAQLILTSARLRRGDPGVQAALVDLSAREFLPQPFSVLDFMDSLRRLEIQRRAALAAPRGGERGAPQPSGLSTRNLAQMAQLWRSRASGVIRVEGAGGGGVKGWVTLKGGGPVHASDWSLLEGLLYGDELRFDRAAVDGQGDWVGLGRMLFSAARDPEQVRYASGHLYEALVTTVPADVIGLLPISEALRRLVLGADGVVTVGEQLASAGVAAEEISAELHALQLLRLIALQPPLTRTHRSGERGRREEPRRPRPPSPGPRSVSASTAISRTGGLEESATASMAPSLHDPPPSREASADRRRRQEPEAPPEPGSLSGVGSVTHSRSVHRGGGRGPLLEPVERVERRLQQERERLSGERPSVILGMPAEAAREDLLASANRMRRRYLRMAADERLTPAARAAAGTLKDLVEQAWREIRRGNNDPLPPEGADPGSVISVSVSGTAGADVEALLREAQRLILLHQWDQAARLLSRANRQAAFHAGVLAHLGWARFHMGRAAEASDLVRLALEFEEGNADALYFLAAMRLAEDQPDDARQLVRLGVARHPQDDRFEKLSRRLAPDGSR